jgi:4-diphosphocytidyl-2-C-methyl-D-erythritol kinase
MKEAKSYENGLEEGKSASIEAYAPAKLNLIFDILGKRADGLHEIQTLYQAIDLQDKLIFDFYSSSECSVELKLAGCTISDTVPLDEENLIKQAAWMFFKHCQPSNKTSVIVSIFKHIPTQAGLAGGSSNAAATLRVLNNYFGNTLTDEKLTALGKVLGADVPFCLKGGRAIGKGIGEKLSGITPETSGDFFVLVKPHNVSVSTAWAYAEYGQRNLRKSTHEMDELTMPKDSALKDLKQAVPYFRNAFEALVFETYPFLVELQTRLIELGCLNANLTGKGPTLWGLAKDQAHAEEVLSQVTKDQQEPELAPWFKKQKLNCACFLARSVDHGTIIKES